MTNPTDDILEKIYRSVDSDKYESLGLYTIGGPPGNYLLRTPVNTEVEYLVVGAYLATAPANIASEGTSVVLNNTSTAASFTSADLSVGQFTVLDVDIIFTSFTGGVSPTIQYFINRKDAQGNYQKIWGPAAISAATTYDISIGAGVAQGGNPTGTDQSVGLDFGDILQVGYVTTGAPTSVTQYISIKGKGPIIPSITQGTVIITNNNPIANFTLGTSLGATSAGSDMNNAFEGVVLPTSATINSLIAVDYWMPAGRGANIYVLVLTAASYALIAIRRKLERNIPVRERIFPKTHSQPQSRRFERTLPAQSPMVAGYESQYPTPGGRPYQHTDGPPVDPGWPGQGVLPPGWHRGGR